MRYLKIPFGTLTPIWTGGVERNSGRVHETGILGSLRWWYEGIIRGLGGWACDPVDGGCLLDPKVEEPPEEQLCPACQLFGCTGWRRRFRLELEGLEPQNLFFVASRGVYQSAGNWLWRMFDGDTSRRPKGRGAAVTFTFGGQDGVRALWGQDATLRVVPLGSDADGTLARVSALLNIVSRWGSIGAKPQHGFGQIAIKSGLEQNLVAKGLNLIDEDVQRKGKRKSHPDFFSLGSFFSHRYQLAQPEPYRGTGKEIGQPPREIGRLPHNFDYRQHFIPCAFDIRYKSRSKDHRTGQGSDFGMRPWFRQKWGNEVAHQLFGRSDARGDDKRSAGRIHLSHLYRTEPDGPWYLKVWGHVPDNLQDEHRHPIPVREVAKQVYAFVQKMFPNSQLVEQFKRKEVLGL